MTKNNYPEGLYELAVKCAARFGINYIPADDMPDFARALLDALAERGYVLVDAKKQSPIAWYKNTLGGYKICYLESEPPADEEGAWFPLYTHPAIPGRVALPDGWKMVPVEPTEKMTRAAFRIDLSYMPGQEHADRATIYKAMLSAAPTPPTQPQLDGSLRLGAEPTEADVLALPIHKNELHEYIASELDRIAADFECRGLYGAKLLRHEASERRALSAEELDAAIDAAMEASNGNA